MNDEQDEMLDENKEIEQEKKAENSGEANVNFAERRATKKAKKKEKEEDTTLGKELLSWAMIFVGAFIVAYILSNFVIVNAKVPSGSMISTINVGDKVIGFRLAYTFDDPKRGDIIMFNAPDKENTIYIKRVVGLPGDEIVISDNKVYINGEPLEEKYVKNGWTLDQGTSEYTVPKGEYFMMGDNRDNSSDSRVWGTIKKDEIIAKALFRYYPSFKSLTK